MPSFFLFFFFPFQVSFRCLAIRGSSTSPEAAPATARSCSWAIRRRPREWRTTRTPGPFPTSVSRRFCFALCVCVCVFRAGPEVFTTWKPTLSRPTPAVDPSVVVGAVVQDPFYDAHFLRRIHCVAANNIHFTFSSVQKKRTTANRPIRWWVVAAVVVVLLG